MNEIRIDPARLHGLRAVAVARIALDGHVLAANDTFTQLCRDGEKDAGPWDSARYFIRPTFATLRARALERRDPVHEGSLEVGVPDGVPVSVRGLVLREDDALVFFGEIDQPAYHEVMREAVHLNAELGELQREQARTIEKLQRTDRELRDALAQVRTLRGLLPICARCKKIKNDTGTWERLESYVERHSEAQLSHGLCQDCLAVSLAELDRSEER